MSEQSAEEIVLRKYLLANLDEQQREQIEERLICDSDFADLMTTVEASLVDDYAFDALSPRDRERFEQNFILTGERRKNLLFAQALEAYLEPETESPTETAIELETRQPWWKRLVLFVRAHEAWATLSAVTIVILILTVPIVVEWLRPNERVASLQAQRTRIEREIAEFNRRPFSTQSLALPKLELTLQPTLLRSGSGIQRVEITNEIKVLNLRLTLPQTHYNRYTALVRTVEGSELFEVDDLSEEENSSVATILVRIPSELLPTNDYQLGLKGIAADGSKTDIALYNLSVINATARP